jgi:hypothetical protein
VTRTKATIRTTGVIYRGNKNMALFLPFTMSVADSHPSG